MRIYNKGARLIAVVMLMLLPFSAKAGDGVDDVLQHLPFVTTCALKALDGEGGITSRFATSALMSYAVTAGTVYCLKHTIEERRPDLSDYRSFPSGHAAFAFAGATLLHKTFGKKSIWYSVAGYTVAVATSVNRVRNDHHHIHDVVIGAAVGTCGTLLSDWISKKIFPENKDMSLTFTGNSIGFSYSL